MNSREAILKRIRQGIADMPPVELPPVAEVWPCLHPSCEAMLEQFAAEIKIVGGESQHCDGLTAARAKLTELLSEAGWQKLAVMDRPLCRQLVADLPAESLVFPPQKMELTDSTTASLEQDWTPAGMAGLPASLVAAEYLLADSGSVVVGCRTQQERLLCYLPPTCIVVGRTADLAEHLPAVWQTLSQRATLPRERGEHVIITGPSRTADIEKVLILGVHGPKRLIVLLVD